MKEQALTSTDGQPLGPRGLRTRERILTAVAHLIEQHGLRGVKLADVAQEVGFSPPAFYQYFADMDEAILALCVEVGEQLPAFTLPDAPWTDGDHSGEGTRPFVESFLEYWNRHRAVLWCRNVATTGGDERFTTIRNRTLGPLGMALRARIEAAQREGLVDTTISARSLAASLTTMIDRIGMSAPQMVDAGHRETDLVEAVAYIFDQTLGVGRAGRSSGFDGGAAFSTADFDRD